MTAKAEAKLMLELLEALEWALPFAEAFDASVVAEMRGGLPASFYQNLNSARAIIEKVRMRA